MRRIIQADVMTAVSLVEDVDLWLTDPPYGKVLDDAWDQVWQTTEDFVAWWVDVANAMFEQTAARGSLVFFCGLGPKNQHAADLLVGMRKTRWTFRNWITWSKRRGFGKEFDYVNAREEILWFSKSPARTEVTFNKPFTNEVSEFKKVFSGKENPNERKRATTVWKDLPEKLRGGKPSGHYCEKPEDVIERLLSTHSKPGDLVVDPFCGSGVVPSVAARLGRRCFGSDAEKRWVEYATQRLERNPVLPEERPALLDSISRYVERNRALELDRNDSNRA